MMQVGDDPQLLDLLLKDSEQAPEIYRPTNFWARPTASIAGDLRKFGLDDFRGSKTRTLKGMGFGNDFVPAEPTIDVFYGRRRLRRIFDNRFSRPVPFWSRLLTSFHQLLNKLRPIHPPAHLRPESLREGSYEFTRLLGEKSGARPLEDFTPSLAGNPDTYIVREGRPYSWGNLFHYLRYAYCCNYIDFDSIDLMVELGGGFGRQVEVIKKLHPRVCFLMFDLAPQLYVCERYLSSVFPDSVVSYRDTRDMDTVPQIEPGKIYMFPNWKFPVVDRLKIDLFWNAQSFQEMEPHVVANYLGYMNRQADAVYLHERHDGAEQIGRPGTGYVVLENTTLEHYKAALTSLELLDVAAPWLPIGRRPLNMEHDYFEGFWKRGWSS